MPKLPSIPKVDVKRRTSRLKSIRGRRFRRRFGEELLENLGLSGSDFQSSGFVKSKLGLFGGAIGRKSKQGAGDVGGLPTLETPKRESNKTNPSLTTILNQFDSLIKSANKLGVLTKQQEKALLSKINETRKIDKEALIENKGDAEALQGSGISPELLAPLTSSLNTLLEKMGIFENILDEKVKTQEDNKSTFASRFFDELGFGEEYDLNRRRRAARQARMQSPENLRRQQIFNQRDQIALDKNGNPYWKSGTVDPVTDKKIGGQKLKIADYNRVAASIKKPSLLSKATSNIGSFIGTRAANSAVLKKSATNVNALKATVKKIAGPLIAKSVGGTTLKSIPLIGIAAGAGFALNRLIQGDPVGAGLDLASGLLGPLTAIPALVASIVRDSYASVYGVQPEQDPEAPKRVGELKTTVEEIIKEQISPQVEVKKKPTKDQLDKALIPIQQTKVEPQKQESVAKPPLTSPPAKPVVSKSPSGGGAGGSGATQSKSSPTTPPISGTSNTNKPVTTPPAAKMVEKGITSSGTSITDETRKLEEMEDKATIGIISAGGIKQPMPSSTATTRPGALGMGDVRSPYYDPNEMGSIPSQVYY